MIKKLVFVILICFSISFVFAGGRTYVENNGVSWNYSVYKTTDSTYLTIFNPLYNYSSGGPFVSNFYSYPGIFGDYGRLFLYPSYTEDYIFKKDPVNLSFSGSYSTINFEFGKYTTNEIPSGKCQIMSISPITLDKYNLYSNLQPLRAAGNLINNVNLISHLMDKYYYMKTFVFMEIKLPSGQFEYLAPQEVEEYYSYGGLSIYNPIAGGLTFNQMNNIFSMSYLNAYNYLKESNSISRVPYVILKPGMNTFNFNLTDYRNSRASLCNAGNIGYCGEYNISVYAVPIGGKCDINLDGQLNNAEFSEFTSTSTSFSIGLDTDSDGVLDSLDMCPSRPWNESGHLSLNEDEFNGCPFEYTEIPGSCNGYAHFNESSQNFGCPTLIVPCGELVKFNPFTTSTTSGYVISNTRNLGIPTSGSGFYNCIEDNEEVYCVFEEFKGSCELQYNGNKTCFEGGTSVDIGNSDIFYKHPVVPAGESCTAISEYRTCTMPSSIPVLSGSFTYSDCTVGSASLTNVRVRGDGSWESDDDYTINKMIYNPYLNIVNYINPDLTLTPIIPIISIPPKQIKIIKNNINIRNDTILPEYIALQAHQIEDFNDSNEAKVFIENSYTLMNKLNITKEITTVGMNSNIKLKIQIPNSEQINLTVYQIIPKPYIFSNINLINNAGAEVIVLDKDPIIGWYFNQSTGDEEIEYELPGDTEGGAIIITQEPILFNEGELVINYREVDCNADELELFEVDSLEASNTFNPGSGKFYKVCLSHIDDSVNLFMGVNTQTLDIMKYFNGGQSYVSGSAGNVPLSISTDRADLYWDLRVQSSNPNGNYSCLASVNNLNGSLIGDCGYNIENRLWLHLGADYYAPKTDVISPFIAHVLRLTLESKDEISGSGFDELAYCVDTDNSCDPWFEGTKTNDNKVTFSVTCSNDWGCTKYLRYSAKDVAGNIAIVESKKLNIIDKGSACQADCMAKPSPNRYLAECINLNGCSYFDYNGDGGKLVAEACHLNIKNSWVKLNDTHEIMCPLGPVRKTVFTNELFKSHESLCDNMVKIPYPVIYNGEQIIMNIISCINY